jgi:hypothetical protein
MLKPLLRCELCWKGYLWPCQGLRDTFFWWPTYQYMLPGCYPTLIRAKNRFGTLALLGSASISATDWLGFDPYDGLIPLLGSSQAVAGNGFAGSQAGGTKASRSDESIRY